MAYHFYKVYSYHFFYDLRTILRQALKHILTYTLTQTLTLILNNTLSHALTLIKCSRNIVREPFFIILSCSCLSVYYSLQLYTTVYNCILQSTTVYYSLQLYTTVYNRH